MAAPEPDLLWAEDNPQDQMLIRAALADLPSPPRLEFADDGVFLLDRLRSAKPRLVILDLKMPRIGGLEALRRIREDAALRDLPVAIFSAGDDPTETDACRALGALHVAQKPVNFDAFTGAVRHLVLATVPAPTPARSF